MKSDTYGTLRARFLAKTQQVGACLLWTGTQTGRGYQNGEGYGQMSLGRKVKKRAHHVAWFLHHGRWPTPGMTLDHLCRVRLCVLPEHLEEVPNKVNILRGNGATAMHARQTQCIRGHDLKPVPWAPGHRRCPTCWRGIQREAQRRYRAKLAARQA